MPEEKAKGFLVANRAKDDASPAIALVLGSGGSLLQLHEYRDRLTALGKDKLLLVGVNYSYRFMLAPNHLFLDWEFWAQNSHDLVKLTEKFGVQVFCPLAFDPDRVKRTPASPPHENFLRFLPFICQSIECPYWKEHKIDLSSSYITGLRCTATSVMPAINLAYLSGAPIVAIIGVEMDNSYHFWQTERWKEIEAEIPYKEEWHSLYIDIYGAVKRTDKFPNADYSLKDIKSVGEWIQKKGVRAINLAPNGIVEGWERMPLEEAICLAEAAQSSVSAPAQA